MCLLYPQLANSLAAAGFKVVATRRSAVYPIHRLLAPLAWIIRLTSLAVPAARRRRDHVGVTSSGAILPGGAYLFIEAIKEG